MQGLYILLGLLAGVFSGFFGLGGAVILVPAFVYFLGLNQHQAQGTTLALMVPPIGLWAAWKYYQHGDVKIAVAAWVCVGFVFGGFLGANLAHLLPSPLLKKLFGVCLMVIGAQMIFVK